MNVLRYRPAKEYLGEMLFLQRKAFRKITKKDRETSKGQEKRSKVPP